MPYSVNKKNGILLATVNDGTINTTASSIGLVGRGATNYGEVVAENLVWMVEHFANGTSPANPLEGQLWFNTTDKNLYVYKNSVWKLLSPITSAPSAPSGPAEGDLWWNSTTNKLYGWDATSTSWILIGPISTSIDPVLTDDAGVFGIILDPGPGQLAIVIVNGIVVAGWSNQVYAPAAYANLNSVTVDIGGTLINIDLPASFPTGVGIGCTLATNLAGNAFIGTSTSSLYADIAEKYKSDVNLEPGDLVKLGGGEEITKTDSKFDTDVFGVISSQPAVKLNAGAGPDETYPYVGLSGRLFVKVEGKVEKGQRLVSSSIPGVACAASLADAKKHLLAVFGRAIQEKSSDEIELVECVVGVK